jgi:primosomal protein N''
MKISESVAKLEQQVEKLRSYCSYWKTRAQFLEHICKTNNIDLDKYFAPTKGDL